MSRINNTIKVEDYTTIFVTKDKDINYLKEVLIEKGLNQARKFSWENTARRYLEIFNISF